MTDAIKTEEIPLDYSKEEVWDNRYKDKEEPFEWYQTYESLKEHIGNYFGDECKVLHIGCGTSSIIYIIYIGFAEDLLIGDEENIQDPFKKNIVNIDFSEKAIELMEQVYKEDEATKQFPLEFKKMDIKDLSAFNENEFDVVFDKAVLDCVLCGENAIPIVDNVLNQIHRVLKPGKYYICVSNGNELSRKYLFKDKLWDYELKKIETTKNILNLDEKADNPKDYHYIYILTKKAIEKEEPAVVEEQKEEPTVSNKNNSKVKK